MVSIKLHNNKLVIMKDNRTIFPYAYMTYLENRNNYKEFNECGYDLYSVCCYLGDHGVNEFSGILPFNKGLYEDEQGMDFVPLDESIKKVVDVNKDASIILRINLNTPSWWRKKYPEELVKLSNGNTYMQSCSSKLWHEFGKRAIEAIYNHIKESSYKDNVIAFHLGGMQTEEWIAMLDDGGMLDYSKPFEDYYASWRNKYNKEDNEENRLRAFNEATSDTILEFTRFTKELVQNDLLVGIFYGYIGQVAAHIGHNCLYKLIEDPSIDFFASPVAYNNARQGTVDFFYHSVIQSVKNRNKLWFFENDIRTYLSMYPYEYGLANNQRTLDILKHNIWLGPETPEESLWVLTRAFSKCFLGNDAYWWFDMWGGFYNDPDILSFMKNSLEVIKNNKVTNNNEVAVILDEEGGYESPLAYFYPMVYNQMNELGYIGCSYDIYHINDVNDELKNKYKVLIYLLPSTKNREKLGFYQGPGDYIYTKNNIVHSSRTFNKMDILFQLMSSNIHVYSYGNIVYNSKEYLCVTSTVDGEIKIVLPENERLDSVFTDVSYEGQTIVIKMKANETLLFKRTILGGH